MQPVAELFASLPCCCSQTRPKRASPPEGIVAISFRRVPMRLATAVIATVYLLPPPSTRLLSVQALAADTTSFTRQVSPSSETNATEPSVAVDRSDGTEWVAWQPAERMSPVPTPAATPSYRRPFRTCSGLMPAMGTFGSAAPP